MKTIREFTYEDNSKAFDFSHDVRAFDVGFDSIFLDACCIVLYTVVVCGRNTAHAYPTRQNRHDSIKVGPV